MKVCGVDLKSNEANVCLLSLVDGMFHIPDCRTRRLTLADTSAKGLRSFQSTFAKLVADYQIDAVIIRQRQSKGKFAGSAIGFKLEAAIETLPKKQKEVFRLRYFKEMKYSEMSNLLKTSESALKTSYHLAVKKIETILKDDYI